MIYILNGLSFNNAFFVRNRKQLSVPDKNAVWIVEFNKIGISGDDLYMQSPGDDTTIAVTRIIEEKRVRIFTGPPLRAEDSDALH